MPREPANLDLDLAVIAEAFVVVVVGGLGSIGGAFLAALLIGVSRRSASASARSTGSASDIVFSKLTLVVEFLVMAVVLVVRPWGLLGKPQAVPRAGGAMPAPPLEPPPPLDASLALAGAAAGRAAARRPLRHRRC